MDMRIAGSGTVVPGEYENIRISGSGRLEGLIRCDKLHTAGAVTGHDLECKQEAKFSGSSRFRGNIRSGSLATFGSFTCDKEVVVTESFHTSGSARIRSSLRCGELEAAGSLSVEGDAEAETIDITGTVHCSGLINAESVRIRSDDSCFIGAIGGSKVDIRWECGNKLISAFPSLARIFKELPGNVRVESSIEADVIDIANVTAPRVSGRIVKIGETCNIDLVQYSEEITVSPKAHVGRTEKI